MVRTILLAYGCDPRGRASRRYEVHEHPGRTAGDHVLSPAAPSWLVLTEAIASAVVALLLLTQPGVDNLLTLLALLGLYWLLGGVLELVGLLTDRGGWAWKALSAVAGIAPGLFILRHPLWSTLLVPVLLARTLGAFGLAVGGIYLLRMLAGGGRGAAVLGTQSLVLGVILVFGSPAVMVWGCAAVMTLACVTTLVVALRIRLSEAVEQSRRARQPMGS
jgi:uncharacterized membrane protein HdeD (DUF308 family)